MVTIHAKRNPFIIGGVLATVLASIGVAACATSGPHNSPSLAQPRGSTTTTTDGLPSGPARGAAAACVPGKPDPAYTVSVKTSPDLPKVEGTTFHLLVLHHGQAVTGAKVCLSADMTGMHHRGLYDIASESSAGTYDVSLKFDMGGPYVASVDINEPGRPAVTARIGFPVS